MLLLGQEGILDDQNFSRISFHEQNLSRISFQE